MHRHLPSEEEKSAGQIRLIGTELTERGDVDSGNDEHVGRRLGRQVAKRHRRVALGDKLRPELTGDDPAEYAVRIARVFHALLPPSSAERRNVVKSLGDVGLFGTRSGRSHLASMPELPEVETVRQTLLPQTVGRTITGLRVGDFDGVVGVAGVDATRAGVVGREIRGISRRGKYLFFELSDDSYLLVHLRMTGKLQIAASGEPPLRFEHLALVLSDGLELRFADQRKFGRVLHLLPDGYAAVEQGLGPEPLDSGFTSERLEKILAGRTAKLKSALLDQRRVAGLGNIYVDEALFRAGLHPERAAGSLSAKENRRLHGAIQDVLREALTRRGTSISSYTDGYGASGENQHNLRVYGRGRRGEPCPTCGGPLSLLVIGGRSSHFCPHCQPL